jgi:signal transduction histidine kinase
MSLRAVSLRAQLLLAFVTVIVGTTAGLTLDAHRTNIATLQAEARTDASVAANARAQALRRMLENRQRRAEGVLAGARELCGETKPAGTYALAPDCMRPMLNAFRAAEGATGALIMHDHQLLVSSGAEVPHIIPRYPALAAVIWPGRGAGAPRLRGAPAYVMYASSDRLSMFVQYGSGEVASIFRDESSLGKRGEAFLLDGEGRLLTSPRYGATARRGVATPPGARVEPAAACGRGAGELLDVDYRGVQTLHAYQPVPAIDGACVDAHVNWDEVLQPAYDLRDRLLTRGLLFILAGAVFTLIASHRIAAPVQRLARAARGLRTNLNEPIPIAGPSEVQALGAALREASAELVALVGREQAARREAQAANRAKDRFLAAVSHELRTPLTAILGWTHIMRSQHHPLDARIERGLEAIERNADTQRRLVEDLLDVSRIVAGRFRIESQTVDLASVVERALDANPPPAEQKGVGLHTRIEDPGLTVIGDPMRLEQVVSNLTANAVKFSRPAGSVLVAITRVENNVQLSVRDEGEGIDPAVLPHVFDWFWQAEPEPGGASSGLGLGLGIVRQLVEIHGGSVRAESDGHGLGSRFIVTLPLDPACAGGAEIDGHDSKPSIAPNHSSFGVH